jgi:hypothetical protein
MKRGPRRRGVGAREGWRRRAATRRSVAERAEQDFPSPTWEGKGVGAKQ